MKFNKRARRTFEIVETPALWKLIAAQVADDVGRDMRDVDVPLEIHGKEGALLSLLPKCRPSSAGGT